MATEEAEVAEATKQVKKGGGLAKTIGLGFGLFFLVVTAQFVTDIVGCMVMPGLMPGCPVAPRGRQGARQRSRSA